MVERGNLRQGVVERHDLLGQAHPQQAKTLVKRSRPH